MKYRRWIAVLLILIALLVCMIMGTAALPGAVRVLPGRYAYYLPAPLRELRQVEHPITLPMPVFSPGVFLSPTPAPRTPTPTATPEPDIPTLTPTPSPTLLPVAHALTGLRHEHQGWNNCGPATLAMALSFWGGVETQYNIAPTLKPDPEDKNVSPEEMALYVESLGLAATWRVGGDLALLKRLLAHGYPVIVETWEVRDARDQLGHYRLLVGYDDATEHFITYDSLLGPDLPVGYAELDELWRVFNRVFLIIYPAEHTADVAQVLGPWWDAEAAFEHALQIAQTEAQSPPPDCVAYAACADVEAFAWFNIGSSLIGLDRYDEAAAAYDQARVLGLPWRMLWYQFGPYAAYDAVGRYADVIALTDATLRVTVNLEESHYWRGRARLALGDTRGAQADFAVALRYHPGWLPAQEALDGLSQ